MLDVMVEASKRCGELIGGKYVLGDVIGAGGMGVVYCAVQRSLGRKVAVKVPRLDVMTLPFVHRRFRTEAFVASRLWHRNIVAVIDYGETGGDPFLVMEHVQGRLLGRMVHQRGPLPLELAADLVTQVLDALSESHASGIVHADVKSDNVLVETRRDGSELARLFDFGLARSCAGDSGHEPELIYGTPQYMAPELVRGQAPSPASDLYAVGTLLYELLTGTTPFCGGGCQEVMARQLTENPVPPSRRRPDGGLAAGVDELVMWALDKRPGSRIGDARTFAESLHALVRSAARGEDISTPARFSTSAPTHDLVVRPEVATAQLESARVGELRRSLSATLVAGDRERIIAAYLALARCLLDESSPRAAATELERAVERLAIEADAGRPASSLWCLLVLLAAVYGHLGDSLRARELARAAHEQASRAQSLIGQEQAKALFARLVRGALASAAS